VGGGAGGELRIRGGQWGLTDVTEEEVTAEVRGIVGGDGGPAEGAA
jgi:hypothetical protein